MTTTKNDDNRDRWQTAEGRQLAQEVWRRLASKESLHDLSLATQEGRTDLRGISAPEVATEVLPPFQNWAMHRVKSRIEFRNIEFENMDFADSRLEHVQFFNSRIAGCRFDNANCDEWGVRATDVVHTTFLGASLRNAVLGPWYEGRENRYNFVNFGLADMQGLISTTATYVDCDFSNAKLDKIDFQSSSFVRCRFAGEIREVLFYDNAFDARKQDPNPMEDVDFSNAKLRWVEFRRLDLDRVRLPNDEDQIVVKDYRCVLKSMLQGLGNEDAAHARVVRAILQNRLKWIGPRQETGMFSRLDFRDSGGTEAEELALDLLRRAKQECSRST